MKAYHKFYSEDQEFSIDNTVYTGYVIQTYSKYTDLSGNQLQLNSTFLTDLHNSQYYRDRLITGNLELPNQLSSIQIQPNDILTNVLINSKLDLLYQNNVYIHSTLLSPSNYIPSSDDVMFFALSSETFQPFNYTITSPEYSNTVNYTNFENILFGYGISHINNQAEYTLFCVTSSMFITLSGDDNNLTKISETNLVSDKYSYTYKNITSIDLYDHYMFICDKDNNSIYKYNILNYISNDNSFSNTRELIEVFGNIGEGDMQLNSPLFVTATKDNIAIYDSGNFIIKIFDNNFNFQKRLTIGNLRELEILALKYNNHTQDLYALVNDNNDIYIYVISPSYNYTRYKLSITISEQEQIKNISFSQNDSNYWYLTTSDNIYKFLVNKPGSFIGVYSSDKLFLVYLYKWNYTDIMYNNFNMTWNSSYTKTSTHGNYIGLNCVYNVNNYDKIFMFKYGRFYIFNEPNTYINLLNFTNKQNFSLSSIKISDEEFIQPSTFNKEIYKLLYNLITIKNNILGCFTGKYDVSGVFKLVGYDYSIDLDFFNIDNVNDFIVHANEPVNFFTFNRILSKIYHLQQTLLDNLSIQNNQLKPYPLTRNILILE